MNQEITQDFSLSELGTPASFQYISASQYRLFFSQKLVPNELNNVKYFTPDISVVRPEGGLPTLVILSSGRKTGSQQ